MNQQGNFSLLRLLHLASPALPVGGFAYSQGLEWAIEDGQVKDSQSAKDWIKDCLYLVMARQELILWACCFDAVKRKDYELLCALNQRIYALRETSELRDEALQMGQSLAKIFPLWSPDGALEMPLLNGRWTYTAAHAALCASIDIEKSSGMTAYVWTWSENQVLAAVKHIPLGQTEGQRVIQQLQEDMINAVNIALQAQLDEIGSATLGLAIASSKHETQYSRLFRS